MLSLFIRRYPSPYISEKDCKRAKGEWHEDEKACYNTVDRLFFYEGRWVDGWTFFHWLTALGAGFITLTYPAWWILLSIVLFEFLEQLFIGRLIFGWDDKYYEYGTNAVVDILVGFMGVFLARYIALGLPI